MTFSLSQIQQQAEAARSIHEASMEATEGGSAKQELKAGRAIAVITGYVETGDHEVKSGKSKGKVNSKGFMEIQLFDIPGVSDGLYTRTLKDKSGVETTVGARMRHNFNNISRFELSTFRKDFDRLCTAAGVQGASSMIDLLGKVVIVELVENESNGKTYINLDMDKLGCAYEFNALAGKVDTSKMIVDLPVVLEDLSYSLFLWDAPTIEAWDALEIEGEREVEKDGKKTMVSKNWLQELIMSAVNYSGSPLESIRMNSANTGEALPKAKKETKPTDAPEASPEAPESVSAPAEVETPVETEESAEITSLLASREALAIAGLPVDAIDAKLAELRG